MTTEFTKRASCVVAIHPETGHVLAATRRGTTDDWGIIGGKQDPGESGPECAHREFLEETGYTLQHSPVYLGSFVDEEGWDIEMYVITDHMDIHLIANAFNDGPREIEPGITISYVPYSELMVKTFAKFNTDMLGPLLAFLL